MGKIIQQLQGPYEFYNGEVTLYFDPTAHKYLREYGDEFVPVDGVTTSVKIIDKSDALIPWAAKKVVESAYLLIPKRNQEFDFKEFTTPIPVSELRVILDKAKKAPKEIKEQAGDVGHLAHNCLEKSIQFAIKNSQGMVGNILELPEDQRARNCVKAALNWMGDHKVIWIETERKIYSRIYDYAGTMDGLAWVDSCDNPKCCPGKKCKRVLTLIDWKSSNGLWPEYLYQTAAYQNAYEEEIEEPVVDRFILRLGKDDGKFEPWHLGPEHFQPDFECFLACLTLSRLHRNTKERVKVIRKPDKKT